MKTKSSICAWLSAVALIGVILSTGCQQQEQVDPSLAGSAPTPKPGASVVVPTPPPGKQMGADGAAPPPQLSGGDSATGAK